MSFNLKNVILGSENIALAPDDSVQIFSSTDLQPKQTVKIYGEVNKAGNNTFGVLAQSIITDFGTVHIVLDRCMPVDQVVLVRPAELVLETLRAFEVIDDPKTFDGVKKTIIGEYGYPTLS